jgi:two-component system, cell cycle response regulator
MACNLQNISLNVHPWGGKIQMTKSELKILLINYKTEDAQIFQSALSGWEKTSISLEIAETPSQGMDRIQKGNIDLILLDLSKSVIRGLEALKELRTGAVTLPIIAVIGNNDEEIGISAVKEGAQDYLFKNIIDRDSLKRSIRYALSRHQISEELRVANEKILEQQNSVIEQGRLKSLLEQSGTIAHEINQPLTVLLGSICLMKMDRDNPEKISRHMEKIEESGKRISATVKKIQAIRYDKNRHFLGGASFGKPEQNMDLAKMDTPDENFKNLNDLFKIVQSRFNRTAA